MSPDNLEQRRNWFRFFPDGTLEFVVVTRVLSVLLMVLLFVVQGTQQTAVFLALCGMLWIDYLLTLFWISRLASDLRSLPPDRSAGAPVPPAAGIRTLLVTALPATLAFAIVAPWPQVILPASAMQPAAIRLLVPVLGLAFLLSLMPAYRRARSLSLGPAIWTAAMLVPLLHWLGIHRLLNGLHGRIVRLSGEQSSAEESGPQLSASAADVLWIITILPWLLIILLMVLKGTGTMSSMPYRIVPVCGAMLFGLFSAVDLAAMEKVQKRFVRLIRSL
jgi:hypothetical protein